MTDDLRKKYPRHKIKYKPQADCVSCHGTGEYSNRAGGTTLCICTCVDLEGIAELFQRSIKKQRQEMDEEILDA